MTAPALFDRKLRRLRRERSLSLGGTPFLHEFAFAELLSRLDDVKQRFVRPLLIGCTGSDWLARLTDAAGPATATDPAVALAAARGGVAADEDRLPFADATFDLVLAVGSLDSIDDLPGALLLIRRILRPDGLMLAALASAGSLPRLRSAMLAADALTGGATPRLHPALDVRTGGDLLARAGFVLPVADTQRVELSYATLSRLVSDLRGHGATNILERRSLKAISKAAYAAASAHFAQGSQGGRTLEIVELLFLSGWRPAGNAHAPFPS